MNMRDHSPSWDLTGLPGIWVCRSPRRFPSAPQGAPLGRILLLPIVSYLLFICVVLSVWSCPPGPARPDYCSLHLILPLFEAQDYRVLFKPFFWHHKSTEQKIIESYAPATTRGPNHVILPLFEAQDHREFFCVYLQNTSNEQKLIEQIFESYAPATTRGPNHVILPLFEAQDHAPAQR